MSSRQEKQAQLVIGLINANQQGKLTWDPFPGGESCVSTLIGDKIIFLSEVKHKDTISIKVEIYAAGKLVESFLDDDLAGVMPDWAVSASWYQSMVSLLEDALMKASGVDTILDSLIKDLDEQIS